MDTTKRARRRATTFRRVGWLAVAAMATLALVGPAAGPVAAASVTPIEREGNITTCPTGYSTIFLSPQDTSGTAAGVTVNVTYIAGNGLDFSAAGGLVYIAYMKGGNGYNEYNYEPTGVASDSRLYPPNNPSGGPAGISHSVFCVKPSTTTTTSTTTTGTTTTGTTTTGTTTTGTTTTGTTTTDTTTGTTTTGTTTTGTTTTGTTTTGTTTTGTGGIGGVTARPVVTPPPTDALPATGTPGGDSWRIALLALAGLLATILLLTPVAPARNRRR